MGVKLRFFRDAWWIFVDHHGKRRAKRVGDQQTARRVAKELREQLAGPTYTCPSFVPKRSHSNATVRRGSRPPVST